MCLPTCAPATPGYVPSGRSSWRVLWARARVCQFPALPRCWWSRRLETGLRQVLTSVGQGRAPHLSNQSWKEPRGLLLQTDCQCGGFEGQEQGRAEPRPGRLCFKESLCFFKGWTSKTHRMESGPRGSQRRAMQPPPQAGVQGHGDIWVPSS